MASLYFTLFCILHLWIIAFLLISMQNNKKANGFLAFFLLLFSTVHIQHFALQAGFLSVFPYLDPLCGITLCLAFPVFLFYVKSMTGTFHWNDKKNFMHLTILFPAIVNFLYLLIFKNAEDLKDYYYQKNFRFSLVNALLLGGMTLLLLMYVLLCLVEIKNYTERLKNNFSTIEKLRLDWLKQLILLLLFLSLFLAPVLIVIGMPEWNRIGMGIYTSTIYLTLMVKTFNQTSVISGMEEIKNRKGNTALLPDKEEFYLNELEEFLKTNKPYLNPNLTIKQLASDLDIPAHILSYLINKRRQQTFFDLINFYRVEEVKRLLKDSSSQNLTNEAIGFESGFGSKTTFNRIFREMTGMTPSQYRIQNSNFYQEAGL